MKKGTVIIITIVILIIVSLAIYVHMISRQMTNYEISNNLVESKDAISDYENVLLNIKNKFVKATISSKFRNPFCTYSLIDNDRLTIYKIGKINQLKNSTLKDIIFSTKYNHPSFGYTYLVFYEDEFSEMSFTAEPTIFSKKIYFNIDGANTRLILQSDSVALYYSNYNNFNVKFSQGESR